MTTLVPRRLTGIRTGQDFGINLRKGCLDICFKEGISNLFPRVTRYLYANGSRLSEMDRYSKILLLANRWPVQIHLIPSGGPPKDAKAERAWGFRTENR